MQMKIKVFINSICRAAIFGVAIAIASKASFTTVKSNAAIDNTKKKSSLLSSTVCYDVKCSKGKCQISHSPSVSHCNFRNSNCDSVRSRVASSCKSEIIANETELSHQLALLKYLKNSKNTHASDAYIHANAIYVLFTNSSGTITNVLDIDHYHAHLRAFHDIVAKYFSSSEQKEIENI